MSVQIMCFSKNCNIKLFNILTLIVSYICSVIFLVTSIIVIIGKELSYVSALGIFVFCSQLVPSKYAASILLFRYESDSIFKPIIPPKYIIIKGKTGTPNMPNSNARCVFSIYGIPSILLHRLFFSHQNLIFEVLLQGFFLSQLRFHLRTILRMYI